MISSTSNPQVKYIRQLCKKSKLRHKDRLFSAEGVRILNEVPKERVRNIYISESFIKSCDITGFEADKIEVVTDEVFKSIADTTTPQGILSLIEMPRYNIEEMIRDDSLLIILEDLQDPGNLGTIMRMAEGAGACGVIMTKQTTDLFSPKAVRATMGAIFRMPYFITDSIEETISQLKKASINIYAATLDGDCDYDKQDYTNPSAIIIGNEGAGIKPGTAALADKKIFIPMKGSLESLNAAMAAGIITYEAARQRRQI